MEQDQRILPLLLISLTLTLAALGIALFGDDSTPYGAGGSASPYLNPAAHQGGGATTAPGSAPSSTASPSTSAPSTTTTTQANCGAPMAPPAGWSATQMTNDEHFSNMANWNYGVTDNNASGPHGGYSTWGQTGSYPYLGALTNDQGLVQDYDLPGNVFQTSTGLNPALLSTYTPQTFNPSGCGISFEAHYTGPITYNTSNEGSLTEEWSSGVINSYNKLSFPTAGHSAFYVQVLAKLGCAGPNDNNGSWSSIWFLGQGNESREIDLQESGIDGGQSTQLLNSHLQSPAVSINSTDSAVDLCGSYNVYGVSDIGGVVTTYVNGVQAGSAVDGSEGPYFIILGQAVFGPGASSFASIPTANVDMTESVGELQVYQR